MSYRHTHVTQFIYADEDSIRRFVEALRQHFPSVHPHLSENGPGWVTFMGKDHDAVRAAAEMPDIIAALEGILPGDIEIVSAWEDAITLTRVWTVRGRERPGQ